ncbi:hypothetical protein K438DRAFT_1962116 [Mycena galopus ATCC 62051]|nr:hypothetical protein K438DRAFT_1962116 [Mycena galopus ATCC 62051]
MKTHALKTLERLLAAAFVPETPAEDLDYFLSLQYTFERNGAFTVEDPELGGIVASSTFRLDLLINQGTIAPDAEPEVSTLTSQLGLALSKGRYTLEVLDLFISSRHLSSTPFASSSDSSSDSPLKSTSNSNSDSPLKPAQSNNSASPVKPALGAPLPLASAILDTLSLRPRRLIPHAPRVRGVP